MLSEIVKDAPSDAPTEAETAAVLTPDVKAEPAGTDAPEPKEDKSVPLAALHEERQRRKEAQQEVQRVRQEQQQFIAQQQQRDQEFTIAQQRLAQLIQRQQTAPPPDKTQDPLGYTVHAVEQTQAQVDALARQQWERNQHEQQQAQFNQQRQQQENQRQALVSLTVQAEQEFAKTTPDYQEAVNFLKTRRVKELVAAGWDQEQAVQGATQEGWQLAHQWLSQGRNPAQMAYGMATATGYAQKMVDATQKQEMQEAGQRAAKATGGGTVRGKIGAAQMASMSVTQLARMSDEDFRAAMGG